jgi:LacI family transcriptional regulator
MDYDLLVSTRSPGEDELRAYQSAIQGRRVDGFVVVRTRRQDQRIEYLCEQGFPFVAFGRVEGVCKFPYVDEDSEYGMQLIVKHLVDLGHYRFAFIAAPEDLMFAEARQEGYRKGLKQAGIEIDEGMIITGDMTQSSGYRIASKILASYPPPTAIVACNDLMAIGAMSAAQKKGLIVGEDLAITGFDDTPLAEHTHPPLTTVHQPIYKIGRMVCEMLIKRIQGETPKPAHILLQPSLVIRQSCRKSLEKIPT